MRRLIALATLLSLSTGGHVALSGCDASGSTACCRVCSTGKACGDSCISRDTTCNTFGGCACNR